MNHSDAEIRCGQRLSVVGGARPRCKFASGHRGEHWYVDDDDSGVSDVRVGGHCDDQCEAMKRKMLGVRTLCEAWLTSPDETLRRLGECLALTLDDASGDSSGVSA